MAKRLLITAAVLLLASCAAVPKAPRGAEDALVRVAPSKYPVLADLGDAAALAASVGNTIEYLNKVPSTREISFGTEKYTASGQARALSEFRDFLLTNPNPSALGSYVLDHFDVYAAAGSDGRGGVLFTGYYTPELEAAEAPDSTYRYPLYGLPPDLVTAELGLFKEKLKGEKVSGMVQGGKLVPYLPRADIDSGALAGRGLEITWLKDPVDAFFLHVQGSGVLKYPDGSIRNVGYAGANGRAYRSIGKYLIEQGRATLDEMSMGWLKRYLASHPDEAPGIMGYNESYVFFRLVEGGPYGTAGVTVTAERSVAADPAYYPMGMVCFIETEEPEFAGGQATTPSGWGRYGRYAVFQDTGGAIKGPGRVDIYFGVGEWAGLKAGSMRRPGRLYFLAGKRQ